MNEAKPSEETLFEAVLQLPAEKRGAYLAEACGGDAALRERLGILLRAHDRASNFMAEPAAPAVPRKAGLHIPLSERLGDHIGHYKLLQQLGEGGCGVVYMAQQEEPVRRLVALKVIKLGMDTKSVIARFEAERRALAMMDHPNIAKVLDAGTTETGRPFFVMELVRGIRITDYCDQNNLATDQRLELFIQVCRAVQHAHQKGIIHRDLKPSNILVTVNDPGSPGVPKVIDFGIAKATQGRLTDQTLYTAFEQFIGTPAYMSPEQAMMTNLDIDTRSDIYSLGVLLYELLTGKTPFETQELLAAGLEARRRTICEKEPPRPSTRLSTMLKGELASTAKAHQAEAPRLIRLVRGDLDWIVMKCLEKDRTRRYETVNGLAADLKRHLNNEPVVARPPSTAYRLQKAIRRHKLAFMAGRGRRRGGAGTLALASAPGRRWWRNRRGGGRATTNLCGENEPGAASLGTEQHRSVAAIAGRDPRLSGPWFRVVLLAEANSPSLEDAPRPSAVSELCDLFPGQPAHCHRQLGSDSQGVGSGQRQGTAHAQGAQGWDYLCGLLSGRPADCHRQC